MTASLTVALTIPMITCSHFSALEMTWRLHFWLVNSFSKESQFRFRMTKFSSVVSQSMIHFPLMLLVKLYLIENTVFNKHSAFCIFNSILQMILSLTCVKLKEIAEFRFTSDLWKSSVNSHMLYLVPGMTPVVSAGKGSPAHGHTMAQRWRVCSQPHLEQDLAWCDTVGIWQKAGGGVLYVQLAREVRAVSRSSQPSNVSLKLFRAGMVLGKKAPFLNKSSSRQYN